MPSQNPKDYTYGPTLTEWLGQRRQEFKASERLMDGMSQLLKAQAARKAAQQKH